MERPLFSAVVPVYNIEKYLGQCVESLIQQTYRNIEIILVDDGSTDESPKICDHYVRQDSRITVIHKQNGGLVSARIAGAEKASGYYIACIDGDDWVDKGYFEQFAEIVKQYQPDIIAGSLCRMKQKTMQPVASWLESGLYKRKKIENKLFPAFIESEHGKSVDNSLCGTVIRTNLYLPNQKAVDKRIRIAEDAVCRKCCMFHADSIYISSKPLYYYRNNSTSITQDRKPLDWKGPELVGKHFEKNLDMSVGDFQAQVDRMVVHLLFNVASSRFYENSPYRRATGEICEHIQNPYYVTAIKRCKYKSVKGRMALFALKHRQVLLMKLYCCLHLIHRH